MKLKLLIGCLLFVVYYLLFPASAGAQFQNSNYLNTNPDVPNNLHTYSQSVLIEIAAAAACQISGVDPINPEAKCLGVDPRTQKLGYVAGGGGLIGMTGSLIAGTFYLPVNSGSYIQNVAANFGIVKKANAQQGIGFNGLQPTLKLWQAFRNITYMLFVVLFVVVGLGIMFRIKIDPRTVMTLQNQIPKIIIAIVLVTFSYAIAGFMIDLMYVVLYLSITIFASQGLDIANIGAADPFSAAGGIGGMSGIASGAAHSIGGVVTSIFDGTIGNIVGAIIGGIIGKFIGGAVGSFFGPVGGVVSNGVGTLVGIIGGAALGNKIVGIAAGVIAYLVIIIALFSALLRLWFVLIKSYIYILITVVFAPFYIAYGLVPGKSGFGSWIKSMLANLSVYPVTIIMLLLGKSFIDGFTKATPGNPPFVPPMVGDWASPDRFGAIIGLAIILMLPEVANMIRDTLKAPAFKYDASIGKSLGIGARGVGAPAKGVFDKLMDRNRQTGKAEGWLARKVLGRNPITRALFNTVRPESDSLGKPPGKKGIGTGLKRFVGATPATRSLPNIFGGGGGRPPTIPPTTPPPAPIAPRGGPDSTPPPPIPSTAGAIPPDLNADQHADNYASEALSQRENLIKQVREDLGRQGYNENSINNVLKQQFGEEAITNSVEELRKISEEQRRLLKEEKNESERAKIQNRLARIEEKIKKLS